MIGKDLSNPIPEWAEHGADRKVVPYTVATDMDSPNPDSGEEYPHTNTQLFNIQDEQNRFKLGEEITAPYNAPAPGQVPTMDGYVTDYISCFTAEMGRQPTYEEYSQIMTGFTPEQIPVLSGLARGFGVFDHWFCEVPSQTLPNRSFWTAATSSGFSVNAPVKNFVQKNTAETIFNRLEDHGKTWKVYIAEPMRISGTGLVHFSRLKDRFATHFVPFAQFEADAANGDLPDFSFIEPSLGVGHNDYHPACGRAMGHGMAIQSIDPPSSILGGEAFLSRIYHAYKAMQSPTGIQRLEHGPADRLGRTRRHLRPRPAPRGAAAGPVRPGRPARLHVRPLGLPGPGHHRVAVGGRRRGVQPGAPAHLPDRHAAGAVGPGRPVHRPRRRRPDVLPRLHPGHPARPGHLARPRSAAGACVHGGSGSPGREPVHARARPWPRGYGSTRTRTTSRSRACPRTPRRTCPQSSC